jgi:uncharacterized membrane protein
VNLGALFALGHALAGVAFVAGLVGLWIVRGAASRADSLATMRSLLRVGEPFGRLTSAGGISLTILGVATALATGRPIFGPLQGARADWLFVSVLLMLPIFGFLVVVYPRFGRRMQEALKSADEEDRITPGLTAAWADSRYLFARRYELVAVGVVLALMISKPF